ncbi:hypothetical protein AM1BK_41030 [Neobacillus kokaensis]|uniref:Uncharacterized protein n=1 Tax=Neobacillus kokaensis TaxID=2759023 RepID=A0ABQ3N980_9BACI|nr:hypothetical protein AM1BK_41030 [Neobacillus kokaensis]
MARFNTIKAEFNNSFVLTIVIFFVKISELLFLEEIWLGGKNELKNAIMLFTINFSFRMSK